MEVRVDYSDPVAGWGVEGLTSDTSWDDFRAYRRFKARVFQTLVAACAFSAVVILVVMLWGILAEGAAYLSVEFLTNYPSRFAARAGLKSALFGSLWMITLTAAFSIPIGVGAAVYLEEFTNDSRMKRFLDLNIANLAGVPSIVYGMLGLVLFVRYFSFGRSVISGALTMSLLILPVIIIASREAIKAVPDSVRLGAFALGANRWQTVRAHVLPAAFPGILTGVILSVSRALGETAPLIMIGALTYVAFIPESVFDGFSVLPIQVFNWASRPQEAFHGVAAAGIVVLLVVLLTTNLAAILIRDRFQNRGLK